MECDLVDPEALLDHAQLGVRRVQGALRALKARVEPRDLVHDLLRLSLLRADGGVAGRGAGRGESRDDNEEEHRRLSLQNPNHGLPRLACDRRTGGAGTSQVRQATRGIGCPQLG